MNFRTTAEFEIVRTIKEKACYLSSNPQKEESAETEKFQYILPDGTTLDVSVNYIQKGIVFFMIYCCLYGLSNGMYVCVHTDIYVYTCLYTDIYMFIPYTEKHV